VELYTNFKQYTFLYSIKYLTCMTVSTILDFPSNISQITTGLFDPLTKLLITGHENGSVLTWNIDDGSYEKLLSSKTDVRTISASENGHISVGYRSGSFFIVNLADGEVKYSQIPGDNRFNRIWNSVWIDNDDIILTSTYGKIRVVELENLEVKNETLIRGHLHSIFALDKYNGYIISGDWNGDIFIWEYNSGEYTQVQKLGVLGTIQDISWRNENGFAVICDTGKIFYFEKKSAEEKTWRLVVQLDITVGGGSCIDINQDGTAIFGGNKENIIQYDIQSNQTKIINIKSSIKIISENDDVYILTLNGLYHFKKKDIEIDDELIKYRFVKIGLLGTSQTGKTTFCNWVSHDAVEKMPSTFGKKIWRWDLDDNKKIIFHDHGGQETVMETFLPTLKDTDVILFFFKKIQKETFFRAKELYDKIKYDLPETIKTYFVQTFIDQDLNDLLGIPLEKMIKDKEIPYIINVSPLEKIGLKEFEDAVLNEIKWDETKLIIETPYIQEIENLIIEITKTGYPSYDFYRFKSMLEEKIGYPITIHHLEFLLSEYTNQGIIEYYPKVIKEIIFNDTILNELRTNVPNYINANNGFININDLISYFGKKNYIAILDEMYKKFKLSIHDGDKRIFPVFLSDNELELEKIYIDNLSLSEKNTLKIGYKRIDLYNLIQFFSDVRLQCHRINKREGLFKWDVNAYIYYRFDEKKSVFDDDHIIITYIIAGSNLKMQERLEYSFKEIIDSLYGPIQGD